MGEGDSLTRKLLGWGGVTLVLILCIFFSFFPEKKVFPEHCTLVGIPQETNGN